MTKLYVHYYQESWNEGGYDPEDSWSRDSYGGTYNVTGVGLTPGMHDPFDADEEIVVGDLVYVVYVVYGTGDTFGHDGGQGRILTVTKDEALAYAAEQWVATDEKWPQALPEPPYRVWEGYFEWLEDTRRESFIVQP